MKYFSFFSSCRAFFRRAHNKCGGDESPNYSCKKDEKCDITSKNRKKCQRCRYNRCIEVGMNPNLVLTDDQKKVRFRKMLEKKGTMGFARKRTKTNSGSQDDNSESEEDRERSSSRDRDTGLRAKKQSKDDSSLLSSNISNPFALHRTSSGTLAGPADLKSRGSMPALTRSFSHQNPESFLHHQQKMQQHQLQSFYEFNSMFHAASMMQPLMHQAMQQGHHPNTLMLSGGKPFGGFSYPPEPMAFRQGQVDNNFAYQQYLQQQKQLSDQLQIPPPPRNDLPSTSHGPGTSSVSGTSQHQPSATATLSSALTAGLGPRPQKSSSSTSSLTGESSSSRCPPAAESESGASKLLSEDQLKQEILESSLTKWT